MLPAGRISPLLTPPGLHGPHHILVTWRCGLMVEGNRCRLSQDGFRAWQHGVSLSSFLMRAAYWTTSLSLLAISVLQPCMAEPSLREKVLEKMRASRPADLVVLETRELGGTSLLGIFAIQMDSADPDLRRYKLWRESPENLIIATESVSCSRTDPMRVTRDKSAIYLQRLNPGGLVTSANQENHLVWWAACEPEHAAEDPSVLTEKARSLGFSTLQVESQEILRLPSQ